MERLPLCYDSGMRTKPAKLSAMTEEGAEILALEALGFLAGSEGQLERMAAESGFDLASLSARAGERGVLGAVLEFLLANEPVLLEFCDSGSVDVRAVHIARHMLGGP